MRLIRHYFSIGICFLFLFLPFHSNFLFWYIYLPCLYLTYEFPSTSLGGILIE